MIAILIRAYIYYRWHINQFTAVVCTNIVVIDSLLYTQKSPFIELSDSHVLIVNIVYYSTTYNNGMGKSWDPIHLFSSDTGVPPYSGVNNLNVVGNPTGEFPLARSIA